MTAPLSERLASALVALEDAASCYDGDKAGDLRAAARAWGRVADEADGVGAVAHRAANLEHLDITTAGPVVLTGATPSDEEIARGLHDLIFPGAKYHAIDAETWTSAVAKVVRPLLARPAVEAFDLPAIEWADHGDKLTFNASGINASAHLNAACWQINIFGSCAVGNEARATVERAHRLLTGTATARPAVDPAFPWAELHGVLGLASSDKSTIDAARRVVGERDGWKAVAAARTKQVAAPRPAQTCPQCDATEIHCAGCGTATSTAWECADCAAGGDAGREADRLRDAVIGAAQEWARRPVVAHPDEERLLLAVQDLNSEIVAVAPAQVAQPAPVEPPSPTCGEFAPKSGYPDMCRNCHEPKWRHPAPVEPAKGERFVKVAREDIAGRPANMREDESSAHFAASFYNGSPHEFHDDTDVPGYAAWPWAVVDTAPPVATPAPSDVERLAAAIRSAKFPTLPTDAIGSTYLAEAILRHLAGPLPGVDHAEELIAAYVDAFAETSGTICDRWSEVDRKRKDHAIATMRRALLAVGAQEPARAVTVGEIVAGIEAEMMKNAECTIRSRDRNDWGRAIARFIGRTVTP